MGLKGIGAKTPSIVTPLNCDIILYEKLVSKLFTGDHLTLKIVIGFWSLFPSFLYNAYYHITDASGHLCYITGKQLFGYQQ
jgi:hypothetical protein